MIDRKAVWLSGTFFLAMIAAAFWRLSLLTDWARVPASHAPDTYYFSGMVLFIIPACLLFVVSMMYVRQWLRSNGTDDVRPWRRWYANMLVPYALICAALQLVVIARSVGAAETLDEPTVVRFFFVLLSVLLIWVGNHMPKLPPLPWRIPLLRLAPWQEARHLRFVGKNTIVFGVGVIAIQFLPMMFIAPAILGLAVVCFAASIWHMVKLRHEPSP